jgi:hypothetical protein
MVKKNDDDIIEHYDLKFNTDKKVFVAISYLLMFALSMLILFYFRTQPSTEGCNYNSYYLIIPLIIIFASMLTSIVLTFNNTI